MVICLERGADGHKLWVERVCVCVWYRVLVDTRFSTVPISVCLCQYFISFAVTTWPCEKKASSHAVANNHGLRGSASPVLTATGFVNGRWQFSTPTE